jgi:hypothetical protein
MRSEWPDTNLSRRIEDYMKEITPGGIRVQPNLIALLIVSSVCIFAQDKDWRSAIQDPLESQYPLTKASADKSTIVTAGAVLVLRKDDLVMFATSALSPPANTYKDGRITQGLFGKLGKNASDGSTRTFVKGEKFWVTKIEVKDDGVVFQLLSDPFNDARYMAALRFPFSKGAPPTADQISTTISQVLTVDEPAAAAPPADPQAPPTPEGRRAGRSRPAYVPPAYPQGLSPEAQAQMQQAMLAPLEAALQAAPTPEAQARLRQMIEQIKARAGVAASPATPPPAPEAALEPIAPPPPPPPDVETKSLEAGQTKDQVVAILGKPDKSFKVGTKEIYQYKDIKVTFVNGKMTDAQ